MYLVKRNTRPFKVITRPRTFEEAVNDCEALDLQLARLLTDDHTRGLIEALKKEQLEGKILRSIKH